jgi:hypothetical protein
MKKRNISFVTGSGRRNSLLLGAAMLAVLLLGWFIYQPATSGVHLLDDRSNLAGLASVNDAETALQFVVSGTAGPVGRPLSLATFLPQAAMWDESAAPLIRVNIAIHLLNGLLACLFFLQLTRARGTEQPNDRLIALAAMALWLFLPLLASSSLMIVQRMTTLAATFMLLGLNGYLYARARLDSDSNVALAGMTVSLILGTVLAVFSKENGALLPVLVLVMETTLLKPPSHVAPRSWRAWRIVFLGLPTIAIFLLLLSYLPYSENTVLKRGMTGGERLITQAQVLWEYLFNAFVARPTEYGPFHDGYPLARKITEPVTLVSIVAWILAIAGAVLWRRKYPLLAFAVLWFVTGHLLESTTLPLELYFEHRNYLPIMGPVFALSYSSLSITGHYRNVARLAVAGYVLVNAAILFSVTSLWGKPLEAAAYWSINSPNSVRAAAHLAARQMTDIAGPVGLITLQEFVARHPEHAYLRLHELAVSCRLDSERDYTATIADLEEALPSIKFDHSVATMLDNLMIAISETDCRSIDRETGKRLAEAISSNPVYANDKRHMSSYHLLMAGIAIEQGDQSGAMRELELARTVMRSNLVDALIVSRLSAERRFDDARNHIEEAASELPLHPLRRLSTKITLQQLRRQVNMLEMQAVNDSTSKRISDNG